jgi:rRNA maturation RNase YbeY
MIRVQVFNAHVRYRLARTPVVKYVNRVVRGEKHRNADVSVIFIDSRTCRKLNKKYLNHDSVTDVISFELPGGPSLEGEVYVNLDRAREQARSYKVSFSNEVARLVIHGTLHLTGYMDVTSLGRKQMQGLENRYLKYWFSNVKVVE